VERGGGDVEPTGPFGRFAAAARGDTRAAGGADDAATFPPGPPELPSGSEVEGRRCGAVRAKQTGVVAVHSGVT